jgi:hypothetical protein
MDDGGVDAHHPAAPSPDSNPPMALFAYLSVSTPVGNPARGMRIDIDVIRAIDGRRANARNTVGRTG